MKPTLIYTALVLLFVLSANADIIDESVLDRFPPGCRSALRIEIQGFGRDVFETEARILCEESCEDGTERFKDQRCPELCGRRNARRLSATFLPAEICTLCSNGSDAEIRRCRGAVDSGVRICKRRCRSNGPDRRDGFVRISSTSGGIRLRFPSRITN